MKIYERITISMATGEVIHEDSYDYSGPVALCKGGGDPPAPTPIVETDQEKALAEVAKGSWDRYKTALAPFEDKFIARMQTTQGQADNVTGQTTAAVGRQFDDARNTMDSNMFRGGINPNSGRFKAASAGITSARGATTGSATVRAGLAADDQTYQNMQNVIKMGRGEATDATRGMSDLASDASREAANTASLQTRYNLGVSALDNDSRNSFKRSVASAAGMGLSGWRSGGGTGGSYSPSGPYDANSLRNDL